MIDLDAATDRTPVGGVPVLHGDDPRRWRRRLVWTLVVLLLGTAGYYGVSLLQVHAAGRADDARPVDALVVMGAAQYDGTPSPQLQSRLDHVIELWQAGYASTIVVTGGKQPLDRFTEAEASAAYLIERGVPESVIVRENTSRNTYDSLVGVRRLLAERGFGSALLVSEPYHMLRTKLIAEELGLEAFVSATRTSPLSRRMELRREAKEAAGVALGRIIGFDRLLQLTG